MPYGQHPANLVLRFLLELVALLGMGRFAWASVPDAWRWLFCLLVPGLAATAWGVFAVPGDPSRSGRAPVPVAGWLRLLLEGAFFGFGAWGYHRTDASALALALIALTTLNYATGTERIRWLLSH